MHIVEETNGIAGFTASLVVDTFLAAEYTAKEVQIQVVFRVRVLSSADPISDVALRNHGVDGVAKPLFNGNLGRGPGPIRCGSTGATRCETHSSIVRIGHRSPRTLESVRIPA